MSAFPLCDRCRSEYRDPADRRFHAQPNACSECGPRCWLEDGSGDPLPLPPGEDAIAAAGRLLKRGEIVAIKGLGGIHLACDACNEQAVQTLRRRKHRYQKAFALMAGSPAMAGRYARLGERERALLEGPEAPIVILEAAGEQVASGVAPGQNTLGVMLPYTPLHHLLMQRMEQPIILTSGNRSDEPQCIDNQDARERLLGIADYFLLHDRDIVNRLDDSVVRVAAGAPRLLRRARGYAPAPIPMPAGFGSDGEILAMGGELKNTFCLLQKGRALLSQHMGDLENAVTFRDYRHNLSLYQRLFRQRPGAIAVDLHPDYLSTQLGQTLAAEQDLPLIGVQHHHAHIAACLAEQGVALDTAPLLGVVLDGLGYGDDGTLWGGEFLLADYRGYRRLAHLLPVAMPGGTQAMREPWRNSYAHLHQAFGWDWIVRRYRGLEIVRRLCGKPLNSLAVMLERGINSPRASSCGRLFDAVAAAIGICAERQDFEGQAAIELESLAAPVFHHQGAAAYHFETTREQGIRVIGFRTLWRALLDDLQQGTGAAVVAARFHQALCAMVAETAAAICDEQGLTGVVLSGGVLQNRLILEGATGRLKGLGLTVLSPENTPANDGGLSLGQAAVAAARQAAGEEPVGPAA